MSGSIIAGLIVKNAVILGYETRAHRKKVMRKEWSFVEGENVEAINQKVHLAQYCALAASGKRKLSKYIRDQLLRHVIQLLDRNPKERLTANQAAGFLEQTIQDKVDSVAHLEKEKNEVKEMVDKCGLILGIWDKNNDGMMVPKLKRLYQGKILKDEDFCARGIRHEVATAVMKKGYRRDMSPTEGVDLIVKSIKEAFAKDDKRILGGYIEVLVLGYRDFNVLPLPRGEQMLDRSITFFRLEKLPDREVRQVVAPKRRQRLTEKQEIPEKKKQKLIL